MSLQVSSQDSWLWRPNIGDGCGQNETVGPLIIHCPTFGYAWQQNPYPRLPARTKPILTGFPRFDWVWLWVWVFPDFQTRVWDG
ncbi:hypothetical protein MTR_5g047920 [Medicago truncatula]|uniref:Uncharacterized protein n=1 Tax=Medicago truncatula TaxID=3880 RepID=G7JZ76_MEDTR|nr:hypothetical protein MTR_5g047920 [Medicago truncatula]